ncbi:hypothetical protein BaRGS_00017337 [Batillaria attramentaria]|uniref:Uncharacterized protein n=1 Tax=Batillaria attramentaria TaxID=370345 RepID=A0ABD0KX46_9CAEN
MAKTAAGLVDTILTNSQETEATLSRIILFSRIQIICKVPATQVISQQLDENDHAVIAQDNTFTDQSEDEEYRIRTKTTKKVVENYKNVYT